MLTRIALLLFLCSDLCARTNILLITADDLGLQLSCYGDSHIETPHLDALATRGVRYETAYVTQASCSSSRSSMFTGLYPHTTGQIGLANAGFQLNPSQIGKNLPRYLKEGGYRTGLLGKLHVVPEDSFPFDSRPRGVDTRDMPRVAAETRKFIAETGEAPFFLMVNYMDPHFAKTKENPKAHFPPIWKGLPSDPIPDRSVPGWDFQGFDEPIARERVTNYYNTIKRLDDGVGLLFAELDRAGIIDDTLVLFLGDHGPPFDRGKTTCYEAGLRVPFLLHWPGVTKSGVVSEALVSAADIVPTLLDAAGIAHPGPFHGVSLRPTAASTAPPENWRETLVGEFQYHGYRNFFPRRAIRDQRYKLIHNLLAGKAKPTVRVDSDPTGKFASTDKYRDTPAGEAYRTFADPPEWEFYDLETDPIEFQNLADDPRHADKIEELRQALAVWQKGTKDPLTDPAGIETFIRKGKVAENRMKR